MAYYKCGSIHPTQNSNVVVDTASGAIANFQTPLAMPLKLLEIDVNAKQESGTPTPDNPKAISGVSEINLHHLGKNVFDSITWATLDRNPNFYSVSSNQEITVLANDGSGIAQRLIDVIPNATYSYMSTFASAIRVFDSTGNTISNRTSDTFTAPANGKIAIKFYASIYPTTGKFILVYGSSIPTTWSAYNGNNYEIVFPPKSGIAPYFEGLLNGTCNFVDLGSLDWSLTAGTRFAASEISSVIKIPENTSIKANMIVSAIYTVETAGHVVGDATLYDRCIAISSFNGNIFITNSAYSDATAFGNSLNGIYLIYELATPKTPTITPEQLATLKKAFAATYYGGHFTQDKDGKRKFVVTHGYESYDLSNIQPTTANGWDSWLIYRAVRAKNEPNSPIGKLCNCCPEYAYAEGQINRSHYYITGGAFVMYLPENTYRDGYLEYTYPLETPYVIDLPDGQPIKSLPGVNNIYADTGDTSLQFAKIGN